MIRSGGVYQSSWRRESKEKFRALVENCGDGILRFDRNHHCLYTNRFVMERTGLPLSPRDFIGKSFYELGFSGICANCGKRASNEGLSPGKQQKIVIARSFLCF